MQMVWLHIKTRLLGKSPDRDLDMTVLSLNTFWNDVSTGQPLPSHNFLFLSQWSPEGVGKGCEGAGSCHSHSRPPPPT